MEKMTGEKYREFLEKSIESAEELTGILKESANFTALTAVFVEKNRLIDRLYEYDQKHTAVAFKIGDKVFSPDLNPSGITVEKYQKLNSQS